METSNISFNTAISNSDESITGIIDETLDEYKYNFDILFYHSLQKDHITSHQFDQSLKLK